MGKIRHMSKKLDILEAYLNDYNQAIHPRRIAKKTNMNHQTVNTHINELAKLNILTKTQKGKNNEYKLNFKNTKTPILIEMAEHHNAIKALTNPEINQLIKEIQHYTQTIIIHGSYATKTQTKHSDIDIITIKTNKQKLKKALNRHPKEINNETTTITTLKQKTKTTLWKEIKKKHILYGNIQPIIQILTK